MWLRTKQKKAFLIFTQQNDEFSLVHQLPIELLLKIFYFLSNKNDSIKSDTSFISTTLDSGRKENMASKLNGPRGFTYDIVSKKIYITDDTNCVTVLGLDGANLLRFGGTGEDVGLFYQPTGIAFSESNEMIYVADLNNNRVQMLDPSGLFVGALGPPSLCKLCNPYFIDIDPRSRNVFVTDKAAHKIQIFSQSGEYLYEFPSNTSILKFPKGISLSPFSNKIYVTSFVGSPIVVFNQSGEYLFGLGKDLVDNPLGLAVNESDDLFVCDSENQRVQVFDSKGSFLMSINIGVENGNHYPFDILMTENSLLVTDYIGNTVHVFNT